MDKSVLGTEFTVYAAPAAPSSRRAKKGAVQEV